MTTNNKKVAKEWFYKTLNECTNLSKETNLESYFEKMWKEYVLLKNF